MTFNTRDEGPRAPWVEGNSRTERQGPPGSAVSNKIGLTVEEVRIATEKARRMFNGEEQVDVRKPLTDAEIFSPGDLEKVEADRIANAGRYVRLAMRELGMNLDDENFLETPTRWVKFMREFLQPFDPREILKAGFTTPGKDSYHGMVTQTNIPFRGLCAHHLAPYLGTASIGYVPDAKVVGLSKLGRFVLAVGLRSPSIQEAQTDEIADTLMEVLEPKGVIVVISAEHTCMGARGLAAPGVPTTTSSVRGIFRDVPHARQEFFSLLESARRR